MAAESQQASPPAQQPSAPAEQPRGSNLGLLGDIAGSGISGLGGIGTAIGGGTGLVTGDYDTGIMRLGRRLQRYGESLMSPELLASREKLERDIQEAGERGMAAEAGAAFRGIVTDPRLFGSFFVEQVPQLAASLGVGRLAGAAGQYAARRGGAEAAAAAGRTAAVGTAVATGTALQTGDVADATYQDVINLAPELIERSPNYQSLRQSMTDEEARHSLGVRAAREAAAIAAPISAGTAALFGAERFVLGDQIKRRAISRIVLGASLEGGQEGIEEGGGRFAQNVGASRADIERDLAEGVGGAAARGAIIGAGLGGAAGLVSGSAPDPRLRGEDADLRGALDAYLASIGRTPGAPSDPAIDDRVRFVTENTPITAEQFLNAAPNAQNRMLASAQRQAERRQSGENLRVRLPSEGRGPEPESEVQRVPQSASVPSDEVIYGQAGSRAQAFQFEQGRGETTEDGITQAEFLRRRAEEIARAAAPAPTVAADEGLLRTARATQFAPQGTPTERTAAAARATRPTPQPVGAFFPLVENFIEGHVRNYGSSQPISMPAFQQYLSERVGETVPLRQAKEIFDTYYNANTSGEIPAGRGFVLQRDTVEQTETTGEPSGVPGERMPPKVTFGTGAQSQDVYRAVAPKGVNTDAEGRPLPPAPAPAAPLRAGPSGFTDPRMRELSGRAAEAETASTEQAPAEQDDAAVKRATEIVNDRLNKIEKRGGKRVREAVVRAINDGRFDAEQVYGAFMAAEKIAGLLPSGANHEIEFVDRLLVDDKKAAKASGNVKAKEAQGERLRPTGEINSARFQQLMREGATADQAFGIVQREAVEGIIRLSLARNQLPFLRETAAHEAFHVLQDYYGKYDKKFASLMDKTFRDDMMITDVDPTIRRKLEQARVPGSNKTYWQTLTETLPNPLTAREAQAYAFGSLVDAANRGAPMTGLTPAFARFTNFLRQFFTRMGNALRGDGFQTAESLLGRVGRGDAQRFAGLATPTDVDVGRGRTELSARRAGYSPSFVSQDELALTSIPFIHAGDEGSGVRRNITEAAKYLQARNREIIQRVYGKTDLSAMTEENQDILARLMAEELVAEYNRKQSEEKNEKEVGSGWYSDKLTDCLSIMSLIHPEIATDPDSRMAYLVGLALSSNGQAVPDNLNHSLVLYEGWKASAPDINDRRVPTDFTFGGSRIGQMKMGVTAFNDMLDVLGYEDTRKFLNSKFTVSELEAMGYEVSGENKDAVVYGSAALGPKLGQGFYQNLDGNFDPLTMDMWYMRSWGRLVGRLIDPDPATIAKQQNRVRQILSDGSEALPSFATPERVDAALRDEQALYDLSTDIYAAYLRGGFKDKNNLNRAAKALWESFNEPKQAPSGGNEREYIRRTFAKALKLAADRGVNIETADGQAIWWYPEKRLWSALGVRDAKSKPTDYAIEAERLATGRGFDEADIERIRALGRGRRRAVRELAGDTVRAEAGYDPFGAARLVFETEERLSFLQDRAFQTLEDEGVDLLDLYKKGAGGTQEIAGRRMKVDAKFTPDTKLANRLERIRMSAPKFFEVTSNGGDLFRSIYRGNQDIQGGRLFLTEDGKAGFVVKDGELIASFADPTAHNASALAVASLGVRTGATSASPRLEERPSFERVGFRENEQGDMIAALQSAARNVEFSARAGDTITDLEVVEASGTRAKANYVFVADLKSGGYLNIDLSVDDGVLKVNVVQGLNIQKNPFKYKTDGFGVYSEGVKLTYTETKNLSERVLEILRRNHPNINEAQGFRVAGARMRAARERGEENNLELLKASAKLRIPQLSARDIGPETLGNRIQNASPADIRAKQFDVEYTNTADMINRGLRKVPFVGKRVKDTTAEDLIIKMQDRMLPLGRMVDEVRKSGGTVVDASDIYMTEELYHGRAGAGIDDRAQRLYKPVFDAMRTLGVSEADLNEYLEARHAPERNAAMRRINEDPSKGAGITDSEADGIMKRLAPQKAKLDKVAKLVDAIVADTNTTRSDNGLTPDYSKLNSKTQYQHYVPLKGFADEDVFDDRGVESLRARTGQGFKIRGKEDRSAMGRRSRAANILGNVILQNEESVIRAEKNKVGQALLKLIRDNPQQAGRFAKILEVAPVEPRIVNGKVKLVSSGTYRNRDDVMVVKEGGNEVAVEIYDARIAKALTGATGLGPENSNVLFDAMLKLNRYLAQVNTTLNPEFVISNFARDLQTANINIKQFDVKGLGRKIISDVPSALAGARAGIRDGRTDTKWAKAYDDFRKAGGTTEFLGLRDLEGKIKQINDEVIGNKGPLVLRPFKTMLKFIEDYNSVAENGIRLSTFQALRDMGVSDAKAAQVAKNLTVNFNKGGENRVFMNAMYLFYNASIQGSMAMANAITRSKRVRKYVAGIVVAGFMQDVINAMISGMDDDEKKIYDKVPDYVLERNYVMMDPFGFTERGYYAFPMPYGFNAFFNMGRNLARVSRGQGDPMQTAGSIVMGFADAFNPIGGTQSFFNFVAPTILDPLVDLYSNRNFAGRPISPEQAGFGPPSPDSQRFWSNTFPPYVTVSQWLNQITGGTSVIPGAVDISPNTIGYLTNYATGAAGAFAERVAKFGFSTVPDALTGDLENVEMRDIPFVRKLYGNVTRRNDLEAFMENTNKIAQIQREFSEAEKYGQVERIERAMRDYPRELAAAPLIEDMVKERRKITREINEIRRDPNMDEETKRVLIRALSQEADFYVGQANRIYNTMVRN
jgi:hypothetical protein